MILSNFVPLMAAYLDSGVCSVWFYPVFALMFVATVPVALKYLTR